MDKIKIETEYIKLDSFLKFAGIAQSGAQAKIYIQDGNVSVNGEIETKRGRKLYKGDQIKTKTVELYVC